jgi:chromosome segregation ATPase
MFQRDEHIHLFTESAVDVLLRRAGFEAVAVQPSLFPYDMWVVARGDDAAMRPTGEAQIPAAFQALLGHRRQLTELDRTLAVVDADRGERLAQVNQLTERIHELTDRLATSEADRAARLGQIHELTRRLTTSDVDRAERLAQVNRLTPRIHELTERLGLSEADGAARLEQIHALTHQIHELTHQLTTSEADRKSRLDVIHALEAELEAIRRSWVWRASRAIRPKDRPG